MKLLIGFRVVGLKDATEDEIKELTERLPMGYHCTHKANGEKLPHNGIFYERKPSFIHMRERAAKGCHGMLVTRRRK